MQVYGIYKNADFTEGRGPMVLDKLFADRDKAVEYMNKQDGIMGRKAVYTNKVTGHTATGWDDPIAWPYGGDWQIKDLDVIE